MYNNPYNRNYPQYYPQYPQYQQPTYPQQPIEQKIQDIKFLNAEQIKAYIVMPNTKELLVDNENGMAYLVSADNMGMSSTKKFSFQDLTEPKPTELSMNDYVKVSDMDKFVQKADLQTLLPMDSIIKSLENKLQALESRLNGEKDHKEISDQAQ